jgi:hypothetical protein
MDNKWIKVMLWTSGVLFALLLALSAALWLLLPAEKIISLAEQEISESTGRMCTIDGFGVSLWRGLALDLEGVELAAAEGEDVPYTARLEHLYLKMKLLPLLSKRIEVASLVIAGPEIFIVRDRGGKINLSSMIPEDRGTEPKAAADAADEEFSLLLRRVVLEDGVLHYHDLADSLRLTLAGIEGDLNMEPAGGGNSHPLDGSIKVAELRELGAGLPQRLSGALPLVARFEGGASVDWSKIDLTRVSVIAAGVQLDGPVGLDFTNPDKLGWSAQISGGADDPGRLSDLLLPAGSPRQIDRLEFEFGSDGRELTINKLALAMGDDDLKLSASILVQEPYSSRANLEVKSGASNMTADLSVSNWQALLPSGKQSTGNRASWTLDAKSDNLDLVELLGADYYEAESAGTAPGDTSSLPFSLGDGRGSVTVNKLVVHEGVELTDAGLWLTVKDSLLRVDSLASSFFGGTLSGAGEFLLAGTGLDGWQLNLQADKVLAGSMMRPFSDIGQYLSGALSTSMDIRQGSALDDLSGYADFSLNGGGLKDWPALNSLASLTNIDELRDLDIDDWVGRMEVRDGRVFGENLKLNTAAGAIAATGSVGLDGSLDYGLTLALNERLSNKYRRKLPGDIGKMLTGGSGSVELGFKLGGTTSDPSVKLDMTSVRKRVESRLKQQADKLIDRLLPGGGSSDDSTSSDSVPSAKKALKGLFKNLLKKN